MNWTKIKNSAVEYESAALSSLSIYFDAHRFVRQNNLRKYLLVSGIAFLLLFTITIKAIIYSVNNIENPITQWILPLLQKFLLLSSEDITKGIKAIFWLIKKAIDANKDAIFSTIFLVIGTPYFSFISSKTEEIISGDTYPFKFGIFMKELKRGISISLRNSIKQLVLILLITLLALLPLLDIVAPLLIFMVQAYYNGVLITDYTLERRGFSVRQSEGFYKLHQPEMFGIGLGFMFLLLIPLVGWFMAPTYGLVASYLYFSKLKI
jgi:CysZ protein